MSPAPDGAPALAEKLRRGDPALFASALFAPEPGRGRLAVLYAADLAIAEAAETAHRSEAGPLIAAMRLQWWRDAIASAGEGAPLAHEIAGQVQSAIAEGWLSATALTAMIEAYALEAEPMSDRATYARWAEGRFGARTEAAAGALGASLDPPLDPPLDPVLRALAARLLGADLALRAARALAARGRSLLPGLSPAGLAALDEGAPGAGDIAVIEAVAADALPSRDEIRALRKAPAAARPALLPLWRAMRTVRQVAARPALAAEGVPEPSPATRAVALAWRAYTGRW